MLKPDLGNAGLLLRIGCQNGFSLDLCARQEQHDRDEILQADLTVMTCSMTCLASCAHTRTVRRAAIFQEPIQRTRRGGVSAPACTWQWQWQSDLRKPAFAPGTRVLLVDQWIDWGPVLPSLDAT